MRQIEWESLDERHDQAAVPGGRLVRMLYWVGHDKHYTMCFVPDAPLLDKALENTIPAESQTLKEKLNARKQAKQAKAD